MALSSPVLLTPRFVVICPLVRPLALTWDGL